MCCPISPNERRLKDLKQLISGLTRRSTRTQPAMSFVILPSVGLPFSSNRTVAGRAG